MPEERKDEFKVKVTNGGGSEVEVGNRGNMDYGQAVKVVDNSIETRMTNDVELGEKGL